jgi:hypothetical protein
LRFYATGRGSGVKVERQEATIFTIRDGKGVRLDYYNSKQQALKAAGLEEQAMSKNLDLVRSLDAACKQADYFSSLTGRTGPIGAPLRRRIGR